VGSADYLADALVQQRTEVRPQVTSQDRDIVHGELLTFEDPEERLPALDGLEGFYPGENSFYRRILVPATPAEADGGVLAWTYVIETANGVYLPGGRWPAS
jgi:gamma-glutamylcyclotransferase (GGCT)/AIG2-like uncharacterized protein YtfP